MVSDIKRTDGKFTKFTKALGVVPKMRAGDGEFTSGNGFKMEFYGLVNIGLRERDYVLTAIRTRVSRTKLENNDYVTRR